VFNLNGLHMYVSSTAADGVVDADTRLQFFQKGPRVAARYSGGSVQRGWLVGRLSGSDLVFRYAQSEVARGIHGGHSVCRVERLGSGRVRIIEQFIWTSRPGSGTNVFDEIIR
jgi:hypothetical protein